MSDHPECTACAWVMNGIVEESDYQNQFKEDLYCKAKVAMGGAEYSQVTTECKQFSGFWSTATVLLQEQVVNSLQEVDEAANAE